MDGDLEYGWIHKERRSTGRTADNLPDNTTFTMEQLSFRTPGSIPPMLILLGCEAARIFHSFWT